MMDYSELKELYDHLERSAADYKYHHQIANLFHKLRDQEHEAGQTDEAEKAQWEMDCFNFATQNGELKPMFSGTDGKGQPFEYPSISKLSEKELDYITERLEDTSNPVLIARYAHILWNSQRKHEKYARIAVDAYIELVRLYEEEDKENPQGFSGLDILHSIEATLPIAFSINYRTDDIRSEMRRLVKDFNWESSCAFALRASIIRHMLEGKSKFPAECFNGFPEVCISLAQKLFKEGKFHPAIDIFQAGQKADNKLAKQTYDWNTHIAESYEALMNGREESDLAAIMFCQNAIEHYKKSGNEPKVKELERRYEELRGKQKFHQFSAEIDTTEYANACRQICDRLTEKDPEAIISTLIAGKDLLPTYKSTQASAETASKNAVLTSILPVSVTDRYGHTAENFTTEEEKHYYRILERYGIELRLRMHFLINPIFTEAIRKQKLNIYTLMGFLEKHSWYGKDITKRAPHSETATYNWLNMIAPSINEYLNQVNAHLLQPAYAPNFVLAMDSLTLKIEGLIRDICIFSKITTFYSTKDKQGNNIVREKDINWLLREEPIKTLFNEDDLLLFKFVLTEKAGLNLRHKMAHCLIDYTEYNLTEMHLLLLVLLRLGKYDFVKPNEPVEEEVASSE